MGLRQPHGRRDGSGSRRTVGQREPVTQRNVGLGGTGSGRALGQGRRRVDRASGEVCHTKRALTQQFEIEVLNNSALSGTVTEIAEGQEVGIDLVSKFLTSAFKAVQ